GSAAPGYSSGQALELMEKVAQRVLPNSMGADWTAMSYQEKRVGNEALWVYAMAVLLVYLVLAALYENWLLPFAVILVVPLGVLGVVAAVNLRIWLNGKYADAQEALAKGTATWLDRLYPNVATMDNNIYTQIGVVLII